MGQMVRMTAQEARSYMAENSNRLQAMHNAASEFEGGDPGKFIGRGFAAFKEYTNKYARPKDDKKQVVSIRLPQSAINSLRATGRGWQTRVGNYLVKGINCGELSAAAAQ